MLYSQYFSFGQKLTFQKKPPEIWGLRPISAKTPSLRSCITGVSTFFSTSPTFAFASFTGLAGFQVPSWRTLDTPKSVTFRWLGLENCCSFSMIWLVWAWYLIHDSAHLVVAHRHKSCRCDWDSKPITRLQTQSLRTHLRVPTGCCPPGMFHCENCQRVKFWVVASLVVYTLDVAPAVGALATAWTQGPCFANWGTDSGSPWKANKRFFFTLLVTMGTLNN